MDLFAIPIVNIAIAIIISWALFAIFCGLIVEAIAQIKAERGRFMKNYLLQQLNDVANGINWGSLLYMHGNIDLLSRAPGKPSNDINVHLFAETMIDVVSNAQIVQTFPGAVTEYSNPTLSNFSKATKYLKTSDVVVFFKQALTSAEIAGTVSGIKNDSEIYKRLVENIERWYSEMEERLTLWYKKKTRKTLFFIGFVLACFLNIDSIQLFQFYNNNESGRAAIIAYYEKNAALPVKDSVDKNALPIFIKSIDSLKKEKILPIGSDSNFVNIIKDQCHKKAAEKKGFWFWWFKVFGVLISAFAASFGGPFWFDVLKKIYTKKASL